MYDIIVEVAVEPLFFILKEVSKLIRILHFWRGFNFAFSKKPLIFVGTHTPFLELHSTQNIWYSVDDAFCEYLKVIVGL